jgi:type III restriction enzyme
VTQRNAVLDCRVPRPRAQIETIKLEDGIRLHETAKVELQTYARENRVKPQVKPFMLVIARDTTHACRPAGIADRVRRASSSGRYTNKVIQVDSSSTAGAEGEEVDAETAFDRVAGRAH